MIFSHQPTRLVPLSNEVKEKARSFFRLGFPATPPKRSTFKPLSSKVKAFKPLSSKVRLARNKVLLRRKSHDEENLTKQFINKKQYTNKDATEIQPKISYLQNNPPNERLHTPSSVTKFAIYSSIKPNLSAFVGITPRKEPPQSPKSTHKPADLCYVLLCMGALLHAEPKPRACLRLFACDGNEAEKVLFFAYLLGAPPGLPTRWLFPFVQKQIFSYLVGHPTHHIGLWNVGNWLEGKKEEEEEEEVMESNLLSPRR